MAYSGNPYKGGQPCNFTAKAENDLSAKQYFLVEISGDAQVDVVDAAPTQVCAGVLQNKPEAGQFAEVCPLGVTPVKVGGAVTAGDKIYCGSGGWALSCSTTGSGKRTIGWVIEGASSGGQAVAFIHCANAVANVTSVP